MKTILVATLLAILVQCNGDISESLNQQQLLTRIPTPTQSLVPPTFENPIKDYTVGLVPPPIDGQPARAVQQHKVQSRNRINSNAHPRASGFINTARPVYQQQQPSGHFAVHQKTHHSSNVQQPQVYQPKTAIHQPSSQQFIPHRHHHHTLPAGAIRQPVAAVVQNQNHQHGHFVSTPHRVHQHSTPQPRPLPRTHYVSIPVQRPSAVVGVQHIHPSVQYQQAAFVQPSFGSGDGTVIQSYPSVSYTAIPPYGSTLNFGNAKLDPELLQIISEVYGQHHK